jgi:hypothetical protein
MADDRVAIWGSGLKFGRKPANGELLIGNGEDMTMATLTAGAGTSITNSAGAITISSTGTGGIAAVTASAPLASSGGSSPDISLTGTVGVANGGTGRSSLTANNVILGNGTSAVGLVAPGASGNVLTSDGTTWASSAPVPPVGTWNTSFKTSDQSVTSSTSLVDVTSLSFPFDANGTYTFQFFYSATHGSDGGLKIAVNGSAAATSLIVGYWPSFTAISAYNTNIIFFVSGTTSPSVGFVSGTVVFGGSSGTFSARFAQGASSGTATTIKAGSYIQWRKVA